MRIVITRGIDGSEIDHAVPKRYWGVADAAVRRLPRVTALLFPETYVATSSDVFCALSRIAGTKAPAVAFLFDATAEALAALQTAGVRAFTLHAHGWTDESYRRVRQPTPRERDRGPGGFPK